MNKMKRVLVGLVLSSALVGQAIAGVLVGNAPAPGDTSGWSSDNSGAYRPQEFVAPHDAMLDSITWWGFHGSDSGGSAHDNFVVTLDGVVQTGILSITEYGQYFEYTLDVADVALKSSLLAIVNDSEEVSWFWQSAQGENTYLPDADAVSFRLNGPQSQNVPEPAGLALVLLALGALALRQAKSRK
jgi:hypothetical protein